MTQIVKRKISFESARNRTPNLLKAIENSGDKSNWGGFVYDIAYTSLPESVRNVIKPTYKEGKTDILSYKALMSYYFNVRNEIDGAEIRKRVVRDDKSMWVIPTRTNDSTIDVAEKIFTGNTQYQTNVYQKNDYESLDDTRDFALLVDDIETFSNNGGLDLYFFVRNNIIGLLRVPDDINGLYVPSYVTYASIEDRIKELELLKNPVTCCMLNLYNEYGGDAMLDFLNANKDLYAQYKANAEKMCKAIPKINLFISLNQETLPLGEMTQDMTQEDEILYEQIMSDAKKRDYEIEGEISTRIFSVSRRKRSYDDNGNVLPFILKPNNTTELLFKTGITYNKMYNDDGGYIGDEIKSIVIKDGKITFNYVIGARYENDKMVDNTGVDYIEEYACKPDTMTVTVNKETKTVDYLKIDFENALTTIYNEDYDLTTRGVSVVANWKTEQVWKNGEFDTHPTFREDYLIGATSSPLTDINVTVNRGNASAFERYMTLTECNTLEDLEKYRNNFFNL